jgi:hypothetical protein
MFKDVTFGTLAPELSIILWLLVNSELAKQEIQKTFYNPRAYYPLWGLTSKLLEPLRY